MRFDSVTFWLFFAIAWAVWRLIPLRAAKAGTLALSLVFYAWWRPEYLVLIVASTTVDWIVALRIVAARTELARRRWLLVTLASNLALLGFFKYTPFFVQTLGWLGAAPDDEPEWLATWVVPVGISFYTFQTLSCVIDVYRGRITPCRHFLDFFLYVSFFPQLVAGPILRAHELLPQFARRRRLSWPRIQLGLYRCITGLFLKVVVADVLAPYAEFAFQPANAATLTPGQAWLGVLCFGAQIFADFAGYSSIAVGLAHLLGLRFRENFRSPYLSRSLSEFWRRWHVTLSEWLRDYLYVPLGGNRLGRARTYANLVLTMLLGGLWHGASWTFVGWGAIHGAGLALERALGVGRRARVGPDPLRGARDLAARCARIALVLLVVHVAWVFFRAPDFGHAATVLERMFVAPLRGAFDARALVRAPAVLMLLPVVLLHAGQAAHEWLGLRKTTARRTAVSVACLALLCVVQRGAGSPFLYFQF